MRAPIIPQTPQKLANTYAQTQATALVRDVWEREYLGIFTAMFTAKNVEAHEARVISLKFEEPVSVCIICSERSHTGWQSLTNNPFRTTVSHCLSPA